MILKKNISVLFQIQNYKMLYDNTYIDVIIELRKAIIQKMPLQNMKNAIQNISKNELTKIINSYPRNYNNHLTMLNLSLTYDKTSDRKYIKFLLENGADPNLEFKQTFSKIIQETMTITMLESRIGCNQNICLLIKHGADIYKKDKNGKNSIDHAIEGNNTMVVKKLKMKKKKDVARMRKIFYNATNLNDDCIQTILSFCF